MKKFMKWCAIIALILIVAGLVIGATAWKIQGSEAISEIVDSVTGGKVQLKLKDAENWGVTVGDRVQEGLDKVLHSETKYEISLDMDFEKGFEILTGNVQESFAGSEIDSLDIGVGACEMKLAVSPDESFHLEAENAGKLQGYIKDRTLHVKAIGKTYLGDASDCKLTLLVPEDFRFDEVEIELGAGVLEFEKLIAGEASLEAGAGRITCSDLLQTDKLELEVGMGEIVVDGMDAEKVDADVGMGSLVLNGAIGSKAELECSMGSIAMELAGNEKDFNYNLESAMGNVKIGSYAASGLADGKKIDNKAAKNIRLECSMGSIEISFTE